MPVTPAMGMPAASTTETTLTAQSNADAEILAVAEFALSKLNESLLIVWDYYAIAYPLDPDEVIKQGNQMLNQRGISQQVKAKAIPIMQKAKALKQSGAPVNYAELQAKANAADKRLSPRFEKVINELFTGAKPRILRLAKKDPNAAIEVSSILQQMLYMPEAQYFMPKARLNHYQDMYNNLLMDIDQMRN